MKFIAEEENPITFFAQTNFRDKIKSFGIRKRDRRLHMYAAGKTGMGKSTLLRNMIISDLRSGENLALLDPHGDLVEDVLDFIPEERLEDVVYFNPADREHPLGFNILEGVEPARRHLVASGVVSIFKKLWAEFWGPRLEYILKAAVSSLLHIPQSTLLDIPRMLSDKVLRQRALRFVTDQGLRDFWFNEFEKYPHFFRTEAISPIQNKIGQFLIEPILRNIIGQRRSTFDLKEIMDGKGIFLANLSRGRLGEGISSLLGSLLVTRFVLEALNRASLPIEQRKDFYLYLDEFQSFPTLSLADALSEGRKYSLNLILAHQYLGQLDEEIRDAVFGNVGTIITFQLGAWDAEYLSREFQGIFNADDLVNLPQYHIYLKQVVEGVTSRPFSAVTLPPVDGGGGVGVKYKRMTLSRRRYGVLREESKMRLSGPLPHSEPKTERTQGELF